MTEHVRIILSDGTDEGTARFRGDLVTRSTDMDFLACATPRKIWTLRRLTATRTIHSPGRSALLLCFEPCPLLTKVEHFSLTFLVRQLFSVHEDRHRAIPFVEFLELAL
jgi:hypothetical protein